MNEGYLALLIVLGTIGAGITVAHYRDLIWPAPANGARRRPGPSRPGPSRPARSKPAPVSAPKPAAIISAPVSSIATPTDDAEMIACEALAKLIRAGLITQTAALESAFDVRAGSSKSYKRVQAKLQAALDDLAALD